MELSIIIVSWNVKDKLRENLRAIFASQVDFDIEVFVVDNKSRDGSADMIARDFPQVKLISNTHNLGFAKANNQAIRQARGSFILLLNPDMRVGKLTLANMLGWMKANRQAQVAGCYLMDGSGEIVRHVRRFPTIKDQLAVVLKLRHFFPDKDFGMKRYMQDDFDYKQAIRVDSIRGGFFMINRNALSIDVQLDERYFLWFEEVDFCRQIQNVGGEVWYTPAAMCVDYVGQSFQQVPRGMTQKYFRSSQLAYFKKWHPWYEWMALWLAWPVGRVLVSLGTILGFKPRAKT